MLSTPAGRGGDGGFGVGLEYLILHLPFSEKVSWRLLSLSCIHFAFNYLREDESDYSKMTVSRRILILKEVNSWLYINTTIKFLRLFPLHFFLFRFFFFIIVGNWGSLMNFIPEF